jgi:nicotinate-nucleotide adenylyltransferase
MRLGIFGGTFDPPHIAHLVLASEALVQLDLDRVLWVLTLNPPHKVKNYITEIQHRLDMVRVAIKPDPNFEFSRIDIDRSPPHFAVDTVKLIRDVNPGTDLVYLLGGDSLENLESWYKPLELVRECDEIGVMQRPGSKMGIFDSDELALELKTKVRFVDTPLLDISATQIRKRIRDNRPYRYFVPPSVYNIIIERNLYCVP